MIGTTLSHYNIVSMLGEGGMGEVYLAEDTKLKRKVALKVLPAEMAENEHRLERFQREAEAVAALNHPNIVHIYSVDEADGVHFLTMELVEGKPLGDLIPPQGMGLDDLFEIAVPLADALAAAHAKGITHRDLKPGNIMVTEPDRRVKILDFGLAKLMPLESDELNSTTAPTLLMTQEGAIVGTVPYMSPEQLEAQPIDHRSDIFSFGVVLYEMTTGSLPFGGTSAAGLISSILTHKPEPVNLVRQELPRHLGRIIGHCLEKRPEDRFQTSRDVHNELKSLQKEVESGLSDSVETSPVSPAAEEASPSSTRGARRPVGHWVWLVGALVALGLAVGIYRWGGSGQDPASVSGDLPAIPPPPAPVVRLLPDDPHQANVEGRALLDDYYRAGNVDRAIELFEHTLGMEADNAVAYAGLAEAYFWKNLSDPDALWLDRALESGETAVELGEQLAYTHLALGIVQRERGDLEASVAELEMSVDLDPLSGAAHRELAVTQAAADRTEAALDLYATAIELDPEQWLTYQRLGQLQYKETRFTEAEESFRRALELAPDYVSAHRNLAAVLHMQGRYEEAAAELQRSLEIEPTDRTYSNLGTLQYFLGRYGAAAQSFEKAIELGATNYPYWGNLGDAYRWAPGQRDKSLPAYQRALELGDEQLAASPDDAELRAELALYRAKSGVIEGAVAEIEKSLESAIDDPWVLAMAVVIYELAGQREEPLSPPSDRALWRPVTRPRSSNGSPS